MASAVAHRLAAAIADGDEIAWEEADAQARTPRDRTLIEQFRTLARFSIPRGGEVRIDAGWTAVLWRTVMGIAWIEVALAIASGARFGNAVGFRAFWPDYVLLVLHAGTAAVLLTGARYDERARFLGAAFLFSATAFAHTIMSMSRMGAHWLPLAMAIRAIYPEALRPLVLWQFAARFPRVTRFHTFDRLYPWIVRIVGAVCLVLFVGNWLYVVSGPPYSATFRPFQRSANGFWLVTFGLTLPALVSSMWRARLAAADERRRVTWFVTALLVGVVPVTAYVVGTVVSPGFSKLVATPGWPRLAVDVVVFGTMMSMPFTTAYAVVGHGTLSVRFFVHKLVHYGLARATLTGSMVLALILPIVVAVSHPDRRIDELLQESSIRWALLGGLLGAGLLAARRPLLVTLDRWLGQETIDVATQLTRATAAFGTARTVREIGFELAAAAERAFGVRRVCVLIAQGTRDYVSIAGVPVAISAQSAISALIAESPAVAVHPGGALFDLLPLEDRQWLARHRIEAVVRVPIPGQVRAGVMALPTRKGGLAYSQQDLDFVAALASTAGVALRRLDAGGTLAGVTNMGALECQQCGAVAAVKACACDALQRPALLPARLGERIDVVRRLGEGGMGVVYLGRDNTLGRNVALKTLPSPANASAAGLLAEARTMAAINHSNVATIFGIESWENAPVLVVEFFPGGTLADRLLSGPLGARAAIEMGIALSSGLAELHAAGILHRDIKPTNVGFGRNGTAKLLDFGIARLAGLEDDRDGPLAGTPLYLSPDLLDGAAPSPQDDLWALSLTVFQAATGRFPFQGRTLAELRRNMRRIDLARTNGVSPTFLEWCEQRALNPDARSRPASAGQMLDELRQQAAGVPAKETR